MYRVKRTKAGLDDAGKPVAAATRYAAKVMPDGKVGGWTADPAAAAEIDEGLAAKVLAEYKDRPAAGKVEAEDLRPPAAPPPAAPPEEPEKPDKADAGNKK